MTPLAAGSRDHGRQIGGRLSDRYRVGILGGPRIGAAVCGDGTVGDAAGIARHRQHRLAPW